MDANTAVIVSVLIGVGGLVFQALNSKTSRDDLRLKAEITYVQQLERRVEQSEEREKECAQQNLMLRQEVNQLRGELVQALREAKRSNQS